MFSAYLNCVYFGAEGTKSDVEVETAQERCRLENSDAVKDQAPPHPTTTDVDRQDQQVQEPSDEIGELEIPEDACAFSQRECERHCADVEEELTPCDLACYDHLFHLAKVDLQADKLQNVTTANMIMDELSRFPFEYGYQPGEEAINLVYRSTVHGNPLRKWLRDSHLHACSGLHYLSVHRADIPSEFYRDIFVEFHRLKHAAASLYTKDIFMVGSLQRARFDKCHYQIHDDTHPRCVPRPSLPYEAYMAERLWEESEDQW